MDFMAAQHFSPRLALGLEGSVLQGVTDERVRSSTRRTRSSGDRPRARGRLQGQVLRPRPAAVVTPKISGKDVNFIAKYLFDVTHENRFNSDYLMVSAAFKF